MTDISRRRADFVRFEVYNFSVCLSHLHFYNSESVRLFENGAMSKTGLNLKGELLSFNNLRFQRFSTRFDIATALYVSCTVQLTLACTLSNDQTGINYRGFIRKTPTGKNCQKWSSQEPHYHDKKNRIIGKDMYGAGDLETDYCRNPDKSPRPWCYTTDPDIRWEYCNIPNCLY
ncbi:unnamed protein product [Oikopleura dioica]|uniref:Kringle domain-containing protein n=1 Tax=Oikopleura dioica TaxID=34765 RepID=E4YB22_OIKDI|nr:unnamed protein product [Oikopleura dioica]